MPRESRTAQDQVARKDREPQPPSVIIYAGKSEKRRLFLSNVFPSSRVIETSGGTEPDLDSTVSIAKGKIDFAISRDSSARRAMQGPSNFAIATDVRTNPLTQYSLEANPRTRSLRKPHGTYDIMKTFRRIARAARNTSDVYYWVGAGTVLRRKGHFDDAREDQIWAHLDPAMMEHFGTSRGIDEYEAYFNEFYLESGMYGDDPKNQPKITDVAGGLAFDVLVSLGAVESVNGVKKNTPEFRIEVKNGIYLALISFDRGVLRKFRPDIDELIDKYPPLEHITSLAMGEVQLTPSKIQESIIVPPRRTRRTT